MDCVKPEECSSSYQDLITDKSSQRCDCRCDNDVRTSRRCEQKVKGASSHFPSRSCEENRHLAKRLTSHKCMRSPAECKNSGGPCQNQCSKCEQICCGAEEWSCTTNCCNVNKCDTGKLCVSRHCEIPIADKSCINSCKLIDDECDKIRFCASSCCRDKACEKACGSSMEEHCCGNDLGAPESGEIKDVFRDPENPIIIMYDQICNARAKIEGYTKKTPCELSEILSKDHGINLYLKMDFLQPTGSFKTRGAFNALCKLSEDQRKKGVIAASAGNHAMALAYAGSELGIPVTTVVPTNASPTTIQKCKDLKARVEIVGQDFGEAERYAMQLGKTEGLLYVNGYDHPDILTGQGTMGCEIYEQVPQIDAVIVSVGGGGLIAGVGAALKHLKPNIEIYGVESERSAGFKAAMEAGKPVMTEVAESLAESLSVPTAGFNALATAKSLITELVTVKEDSIVNALFQLLEKEKIVVEGAGAAGLAAIMEGKFPQLKGKTVVVILCGANIDDSVLGRSIKKGLTLQSNRW